MFVGILQFELIVRHANSLKDKRRVVKSLKDRLHREHMVSVAEIGALEHHRLALMGLSLVGASEAVVGRVLDRVIHKLQTLRDAELGDFSREIIRGEQPPETTLIDTDPLWTPDDRRTDDTTDATTASEERP